MMSIEGELYARQELTAVLFTLAGIEIQRVASSAEPGIAARRLLKTLANTVWDYSLLPERSLGRLRVLPPGDFVWTPHRHGALGMVKPSVVYRRGVLSYGSFYDPTVLLNLGNYQKYQIQIHRTPQGLRRIVFPQYLRFEAIVKSGIERIDEQVWCQIVRLYSPLDDKTLNCLASCRNETAVVQSLLVELVFFFQEVQFVCRACAFR